MSTPPSSSSDPSPPPPANRRRAYLQKSDQPFSRSALKRHSVMTLPSIAHLQHGFAKIGIEASGGKENRGVGGTKGKEREEREEREGIEGSKESREEGLILGPEPERPTRNVGLPWETGETANVVKGERELRIQVLVALDEVRRIWSLKDSNISNDLPSLSTLLLTTTSSIRSIQQWMTALPSHSPTSSSISNLLHTPSDILSISTAARPRTSLGLPPSSASHSRRSSSGSTGEEESSITERERLLSEVRKRSLDVLGILKELEDRLKASSIPTTITERAESKVTNTALIDSDVVGKDEEGENGEVAIYDETVSLEWLRKEKELVEEWIKSVEALLGLTGESKSSRRGRRSEGSVGDEGYSEGQRESAEKLPPWAEEDGFESSLNRAYSIIQAHLPSSSTSQFPSLSLPLSSSSRSEFLSTLSTGTLLCQTYNQVLSLSLSPFGFIPTTSIHEFSSATAESSGMERSWSGASDGGEKVGNTFRRVQNLQSWAAALKHRYSITLSAPSNSSSSNTTSATLSDSKSPPFDARVIASRREGWEGMLERAVGEWAEAVAREEREN